MKTIYKYEFNIMDYFEILMPVDTQILSVQVRDKKPCVWVLTDTEKELEKREFILFGTGHPIHNLNGVKYIGTFQQDEYVWHLFELIS